MRSLPVLALTLIAGLATPASAWISVANERIDRALHEAHGDRLVVAATIRELTIADADAPRLSPPECELVVEVAHAVLGDVAKTGTRLRFATRSFDWPSVLVPLEQGARCILIVDPERENGFDGRLMTVLPWSGKALPVAADKAAALRVLAEELTAQLGDRHAPIARRRETAILAAPILSAAQAETAFGPLVEHRNEWLRRAAIAGLALAAPTRENLERAVGDLTAFAEDTPSDRLIREIKHGAGYAPYPYLFRYYGWLAADWSDEERVRFRKHLWLHRTVARQFTKEPTSRFRYGIGPVAELGDATDLRLLYEYFVAHETFGLGQLHERTPARMKVLRRLATLADVELIAEEVPQLGWHIAGIAKEPEQLKLITDALKRQGVDWL